MAKERLDRFLISTNAINNFPFLMTIVVRQTNLDHDAILIDTLGHKPRENFKDPRLFFKYDVCWAKEKEAKDIIKKAWNSNYTNIIEKLEKVHVELGLWQHSHYRRMKNQIRELVVRIDKLIDGARQENSVDMLKTAHLKLGNLYAKEESYWAQRLCIKWLKEGDRNTHIFHVCTTSRLKKNKIDRLKDSNGIWMNDTNDICKVA
ncbi:hypothetical protein CXB51_031669 [Gossypium anomalum]|uniref:Uncharacterized protein n=1 Tax=Gossypium anomalum TaxID=47600 RepID=A0A8J5YQW7_9ROSI|nr:hypothetical protein CXB51_031669 [Gossypium anomalum]